MRPLLAACVLAVLVQSSPGAAPPAGRPDPKKADRVIREVAGSAEYLRSVPKKFATLVGFDAVRRRVSLQEDGSKTAREWPLTEDAEIKIDGWWGRLDQLALGQRVWVWLKTDRKKKPVAIAMLADDTSQQDIHGVGVTVLKNAEGVLEVKPESGPKRVLKTAGADAYQGGGKVTPDAFAPKSKVFIRARGDVGAILAEVGRLGYHGGIALGRWYPGLSDGILIAVTEKRTKEEIDGLAAAYKQVMGRVAK